MSASSARTGGAANAVEQSIERCVTAGAGRWFPPSGPSPAVRLRRLSSRPRSVLYGVYLGDGERPQMVAKLRTGVLPQRSATDTRPRLSTGSPSVSELTSLEYAGLDAIFTTFGNADNRFGAVRPLDHMVAENVILMDYVDAVTLRDVLVERSRLSLHRRSAARLSVEVPWERVGAWLRQFQESNPPEGRPSRQQDRQDVVERFEAYQEFLTSRLGASFGAVAADGARLAAEVLPERLPMAVGHGDFAPRNVFLDVEGRIVVLDPLPRWAVPRYEDLCRFLVGMRLLGLQLHSHGAAFGRTEVERREQQVIRGYQGDDPVPVAQLRCYELLILLDKWSALVDSPSRGWRGRVTSASVRSASGFLRKQARGLLEPRAVEAG